MKKFINEIWFLYIFLQNRISRHISSRTQQGVFEFFRKICFGFDFDSKIWILIQSIWFNFSFHKYNHFNDHLKPFIVRIYLCFRTLINFSTTKRLPFITLKFKKYYFLYISFKITKFMSRLNLVPATCLKYAIISLWFTL